MHNKKATSNARRLFTSLIEELRFGSVELTLVARRVVLVNEPFASRSIKQAGRGELDLGTRPGGLCLLERRPQG